MVQQGKQLKDYSIIELKSIAYDLLAQREQIGMQIQQVNQAIGEAMKRPPVPVVPPVVKKPEEKKG